MITVLQYAYFSMIGSIRNNHEDNLYIAQHMLPMNNNGSESVISGKISLCNQPLIGVFDGMGGESYGEAAAFIAADTMRQKDQKRQAAVLRNMENRPEGSASWKPDIFLEDLCRDMNSEVCRFEKEKRIRSMGTTAVCVLFREQEACFANIGDSRIYLLHGSRLQQITTDQVSSSIFYSKPPLSQYLGMEEEEMILLPQIGKIRLSPGDRILLCTDGVTDMVTDQEIEKYLLPEESVEICLMNLQQAILQAGAKDNATAILCTVNTEGI